METGGSGSADLEVQMERSFGGPGVEIDRKIPCIDLHDFDRRRGEIDDAIWQASVEVGFFQVINHGIGAADVDRAFAHAASFFALASPDKEAVARPANSNSGWESMTQKRPSTGTLDQKESYQITTSRMDELSLWPKSGLVPNFRVGLSAFEQANWVLAMRLLGCFARKLGFDEDFFSVAHDPASDGYQATLRLLHYFALTPDESATGLWRAGAHTDYDCLTLLHQRPGQRGLQVCPGADADPETRGDTALAWTSVEPTDGTITCNIGDMLKRWSDDQLKSTLHRVRTPTVDEDLAARYSIAFFAQANREAMIQGPRKRYEPISAADYLQQRIDANFVA
ncbi:MAG: isopenicillin N synthase-like dioxygenase [Acidimicrobiales bacterium]|jgi:isopenicillin N synthase-like dioxygenase